MEDAAEKTEDAEDFVPRALACDLPFLLRLDDFLGDAVRAIQPGDDLAGGGVVKRTNASLNFRKLGDALSCGFIKGPMRSAQACLI